MSRKVPTITVQYFPVHKQWQIVKVTDSLEYPPSAFIAKNELQRLVDSPKWKVTVISAKA